MNGICKLLSLLLTFRLKAFVFSVICKSYIFMLMFEHVNNALTHLNLRFLFEQFYGAKSLKKFFIIRF